MIAEKKISSRLAARLNQILGYMRAIPKQAYSAGTFSCSFNYCFNNREATPFWEKCTAYTVSERCVVI